MDLNDLGRLIMVVIENSYNLKKINLAEVSDKQALSMDQFSKIIGGSVDDACSSGGCAGGVMEVNTKLCVKNGVCTSSVITWRNYGFL